MWLIRTCEFYASSWVITSITLASGGKGGEEGVRNSFPF